MKTPMSEQAQLESYPRRYNYIQPVQHGANLVFDTAGAGKQQNQNLYIERKQYKAYTRIKQKITIIYTYS